MNTPHGQKTKVIAPERFPTTPCSTLTLASKALKPRFGPQQLESCPTTLHHRFSRLDFPPMPAELPPPSSPLPARHPRPPFPSTFPRGAFPRSLGIGAGSALSLAGVPVRHARRSCPTDPLNPPISGHFGNRGAAFSPRIGGGAVLPFFARRPAIDPLRAPWLSRPSRLFSRRDRGTRPVLATLSDVRPRAPPGRRRAGRPVQTRGAFTRWISARENYSEAARAREPMAVEGLGLSRWRSSLFFSLFDCFLNAFICFDDELASLSLLNDALLPGGGLSNLKKSIYIHRNFAQKMKQLRMSEADDLSPVSSDSDEQCSQ